MGGQCVAELAGATHLGTMPLPRRGRGQRGVVLDVAWGSTWHVGGCRPRRFSAHIPRGGEGPPFVSLGWGLVRARVRRRRFRGCPRPRRWCRHSTREVTAGGDGVSWVVRERVGW